MSNRWKTNVLSFSLFILMGRAYDTLAVKIVQVQETDEAIQRVFVCTENMDVPGLHLYPNFVTLDQEQVCHTSPALRAERLLYEFWQLDQKS